MKRCKTVQQVANEIAKMENSPLKELNIAQCNIIAKNIKNLYAKGGKESVIRNLRETLPYSNNLNGLSMDQKDRVMEITKKLFYWHSLPWSTIRNNMIRIGAKK